MAWPQQLLFHGGYLRPFEHKYPHGNGEHIIKSTAGTNAKSTVLAVTKLHFAKDLVRKVLESPTETKMNMLKKLKKYRISMKYSTFLVAEVGLEPTTSGL